MARSNSGAFNSTGRLAMSPRPSIVKDARVALFPPQQQQQQPSKSPTLSPTSTNNTAQQKSPRTSPTSTNNTTQMRQQQQQSEILDFDASESENNIVYGRQGQLMGATLGQLVGKLLLPDYGEGMAYLFESLSSDSCRCIRFSISL